MKKSEMEIWTVGGIDFSTIKVFADYVGVSPQAVYRWIYIGMPVVKSSINTYLIPLKEALFWVENYRGKTW